MCDAIAVEAGELKWNDERNCVNIQLREWLKMEWNSC